MNTPPPLPSSVMTPSPSWTRAWGGVWLLTWRRVLAPGSLAVFGGLLAAFGLLSLHGVHSGSTETFRQWGGQFYLGFVVPVFAFLTTAGVIQDDMSPATVDYVFTRSMRRWVFVVLRYLSHVVCLQLQCLGVLAVLAAVGFARQVPDLGAEVAALAAAQGLGLLAFGALGLALGTLTSRHIVAGIVYAGVVELGFGNIPTSIGGLSMTRQMRVLAAGGWADETATGAVLALLVFSALLLGLAALVFSRRETAGGKPREG